MPEDLYFPIVRVAALFWSLVQQLCFVLARRAYLGVDDRRPSALFYASQAAVAAALAAVSFSGELGIVPPYDLPSIAWIRPPQQGVTAWCIAMCAAMICFDGLLVIYAYRFLKLSRGAELERRAPIVDAAFTAVVLGAAALYWISGDAAASELAASTFEYLTIRRFFIQISNGCYVVLELTCAAILFKFWRELRSSHAD